MVGSAWVSQANNGNYVKMKSDPVQPITVTQPETITQRSLTRHQPLITIIIISYVCECDMRPNRIVFHTPHGESDMPSPMWMYFDWIHVNKWCVCCMDSRTLQYCRRQSTPPHRAHFTWGTDRKYFNNVMDCRLALIFLFSSRYGTLTWCATHVLSQSPPFSQRLPLLTLFSYYYTHLTGYEAFVAVDTHRMSRKRNDKYLVARTSTCNRNVCRMAQFMVRPYVVPIL